MRPHVTSHEQALPPLPAEWSTALRAAVKTPTFATLGAFVAQERRKGEVFPPRIQVFRALELTPLHSVRVVMLGQDPYHGDGQAHGLSFSVPKGVKIPPSLRNIYRELSDDLGVCPPPHGCLDAWAKQGVLLLNAVLTVRAHKPNSHRNRGWEPFTDAVLGAVNDSSHAVVFVLWGAHAQKKKALIDTSRHQVLQAPHPSPLSAHIGFFGSRPFSQINRHLVRNATNPINWSID